MDYLKISLIGLIVVITYYLLLQWSSLPQEEVNLDLIQKDNFTLSEEVLNDSKDSLSALDATPPQAVEGGDLKTTELAILTPLFSRQ